MVNSVDSELPLTESSYLILLSLLNPRHGYGIMQRIEEISGGRISMGPGTLYGALKGMVKKKWIRELPGDDSRRKNYALTDRGRKVLEGEIGRLNCLAALGIDVLPLLKDEE